ncbi:MAG: hypothetical protein WA916_05035 [Arcobacter sp.]|uniref:hypothetical protein n=1 Tax=Arcobacter sp. TaxID=1872629 RepID=UPI003C7137FA
MQVSNNQEVNSYNHKVTKTQEVKTSPSTFDSLLEKQKEVPAKEEGKLIPILEKYNVFSDLSQSEEKKFREILADDTITLKELDTLSYAEAKNLFSHTYPKNLDKKEFDTLPIIKYDSHNQIHAMQLSLNMTYDESLNEAMYKTAREISSDEQRDSWFQNINHKLDNLHANRTTYVSEDYNSHIKNIDGGSFLSKMVNDFKFSYSQDFSDGTKMLLDSYTLLQKYYNNIENGKNELYA